MVHQSRRAKAAKRKARNIDGTYVTPDSDDDMDVQIEFIDDVVLDWRQLCGSYPKKHTSQKQTYKRAPYTGDGKRTKERRLADQRRCLSACPMNSLSHFGFQVRCVKSTLEERLESISELLKTEIRPHSKWLQVLIVSKFLQYRSEHMTRAVAAEKALECLPSHLALSTRTIMNWSKYYIEQGTMPTSLRGRHQKTFSIMNDEDVEKCCVEWLRSRQPNTRTPKHFREFIISDVLPLAAGTTKTSVTEETARKWMIKIGYKYGSWQKDVYVDGHERVNVVKYRADFTTRWMALFEQMTSYAGDTMNEIFPPH